jgi:hypothetical protein
MTAIFDRNLWPELKRALDLPIKVRFALAVLAALLAFCLTALSAVALKQIVDQLGAKRR